MVFPRKQRVILLTLLYCCVAALICGTWSTAYPRRFGDSTAFEETRSVSRDDDTILSASEIWTAGARSLTSTEETQPEDEVDLQSALPHLYHLPEIFALNYAEMTKNLRVYIYPNSKTGSKNVSYEYDATNGNEVDPKNSNASATMTGFFNLLAKSSTTFLTTNPAEAQLFFLPVSVDAVSTHLGAAAIGGYLRDYIDSIRGEYNFWNRSLGADHFYLLSHAYESVNHRNLLELQKNCVQVAVSPLQPNQSFYPHKDIVLPQYKTLITEDLPSARSSLAYVNAELAASPIIPQAWKSDFEFLVETNSSQSPSFEKISSSKFCISLSMRNVVDSLRLGCVPVLVADSIIYDLPFQDILKWREFAVVIGVQEMAGLKTVLASMGDAEYARMQYLGQQASKHMEWNDPPAKYDAFHMTMFQLWMRRHSVKYALRSETS